MIRRSIQNLDKDERGQERGLFDDSFRGILVPPTLQLVLIVAEKVVSMDDEQRNANNMILL